MFVQVEGAKKFYTLIKCPPGPIRITSPAPIHKNIRNNVVSLVREGAGLRRTGFPVNAGILVFM